MIALSSILEPEAFLITATCYIFHEGLEGFKDSKYKEMIGGGNINYSALSTVCMYLFIKW